MIKKKLRFVCVNYHGHLYGNHFKYLWNFNSFLYFVKSNICCINNCAMLYKKKTLNRRKVEDVGLKCA